MTGNVRYNCYPLIRLLPTHPHLASAYFIRLLLVATSADPHIRLLPIAVYKPFIWSFQSNDRRCLQFPIIRHDIVFCKLLNTR